MKWKSKIVGDAGQVKGTPGKQSLAPHATSGPMVIDMSGRGQAAGRRVGELAMAAGLTVRTLHYYDEIGLLQPSERTKAGHRLYSDVDVERLYRISLLRRLGLRLEDIGRALDDPAWSLHSALGTHLGELDRRSKP